MIEVLPFLHPLELDGQPSQLVPLGRARGRANAIFAALFLRGILLVVFALIVWA